jgi:2',3'-cyclic-nucleotide 2'-phosphodiesterase / 3'-nucleotidase / 5'-nucleotidase
VFNEKKSYRNNSGLLLSLVIAFFISISGGVVSINAKTITDKVFDFIEITDFHGALEGSSGLPVAGVLGRHVKDILASNPKGSLVIGGGDLYQGSALSNILKGGPVRDFMNGIDMEVTALGNHEFDWDLTTINNTTMIGANYSILCANIRKNSDNSLLYPASKIINKNGVRIAVVGAITTETPTIVMPAAVANLTFTDPVLEINSEVRRIKDRNLADIVLVVIHEGTTTNPVTGKNIMDIAGNLINVNAVFGGHSHTILNTTTAHGIPVEIGNSNGKGIIDLKMVYHADKTVTFKNANTAYQALDKEEVNLTSTVIDAKSMKIVEKAKAQIGPTINEVLCTIPHTLTRTELSTPYGESYIGNWAADVVRKTINSDVGIQNNGGLRADLPAGNITIQTMYTLMPFDSIINTLIMTKVQLKVVLEQAVMDKGKGIVISGIKFKYNPAKPSMSRITSITREDGTAISDNVRLKVAVPDYIATGGDGFTGFKDATVASTLVVAGINVRDALIEAIRKDKGVIAKLNGRIEKNEN